MTKFYIVCAALICLSSAAPAQQANVPPERSDPARIVTATRFAGDITLQTAGAQAESFRLSLGSLKLTVRRLNLETADASRSSGIWQLDI